MTEIKNLDIACAPIQGITDYTFRVIHAQHFKAVTRYFSPYLRIDKPKLFSHSKQKDVFPENNNGINLIPQIMVNNTKDLLFLDNYLNDLGYSEINWNLGCPYPMVTNRKLGAGLLTFHHEVTSTLDETIPKLKSKLSIKMRSGLSDDSEIRTLLPLLNPYPLSEVIIHPRYAKQLYKAKADIDLFLKCIPLTSHTLCYNGDIDTIDTYKQYSNRLKNINRYMLGRGIISNPFLAEQISEPGSHSDEDLKNRFFEFHDSLLNGLHEKLNDKTHVLNRMKSNWEYFSKSFSNSRKVNKRIKKSSTLEKYDAAIRFIKQNENWIANS